MNDQFDAEPDTESESGSVDVIHGVTYCGTSEQMQALCTALIEARKKFTDIKKSADGQTGNQKFKYAPLHLLTGATEASLLEHGVNVLQFPCNSDTDAKQKRLTTVIMGHGAAISFAFDFVPEALEKEFGKQLTYLRRNTYQSVFILDGEKDADSDPNFQADKRGSYQGNGSQAGKPASAPENKPAGLTDEMRDKLKALFVAKGFNDASKRAAKCRELIGKAPGELTAAECDTLFFQLSKLPNATA